jgi:hypothetical protein
LRVKHSPVDARRIVTAVLRVIDRVLKDPSRSKPWTQDPQAEAFNLLVWQHDAGQALCRAVGFVEVRRMISCMAFSRLNAGGEARSGLR